MNLKPAPVAIKRPVYIGNRPPTARFVPASEGATPHWHTADGRCSLVKEVKKR